MSCYFNPDGVTKDNCFETENFKKILDVLEKNKTKIDIKDFNKFKETYKHAKAQSDRTIHIVVAEPVEYDYDDMI